MKKILNEKKLGLKSIGFRKKCEEVTCRINPSKSDLFVGLIRQIATYLTDVIRQIVSYLPDYNYLANKSLFSGLIRIVPYTYQQVYG